MDLDAEEKGEEETDDRNEDGNDSLRIGLHSVASWGFPYIRFYLLLYFIF